MTESAPPPGSGLRCCFCGAEIPTGPAAASADESARIVSLDFAPGEGAAVYLAREQTFHAHVACFRSRLHEPAALLPFEEWPGAAEEDMVLDACAELTHELFTTQDALPFRDRLFASEPGRWIPVVELCAGLASAERRLAEITERDPNVFLTVQHTPHPLDLENEYSLVIFSELYYLWTTAVLHLRGV